MPTTMTTDTRRGTAGPRHTSWQRRALRATSLLVAGTTLVGAPVLAQSGSGDPDTVDTVPLPKGRLLWTSDRARDGGLNIWMLESGADEPQQVTFGDQNDFTPDLSPDGSRLAYASDRDNPSALTASRSYLRAYDLYLTGLGGGEPQTLRHDRTFKMRPTWSPDGTRIAFDGEDADGEPVAKTGGLTPQIWVVSGDGSGEAEMLTDETGGALEPTWSPDGDRLAFRSLEDERILIVPATGGEAAPLTDGPGDTSPDWSPDGTRIVFSSERDGDREIYTIALDGSEAVRLTDSPGYDGQPTWSPDSTMIAFVTERGGSRDIFVMNADGDGQRNVSGNDRSEDGEFLGSDFNPTWEQ